MAHQQPVIMSVSGLSTSSAMTGSSAGIQALGSVRWQQAGQQQTHQQQQQHAAYSCRAEPQQQRDLQEYDMRLHPAVVCSGGSFPGHTQAAAQAAANKTSSSSGKAAAAAAARTTDSPGRHLVCNELLLESPPAVATAAAAGVAVVSGSSMSGGSMQRSNQTERLKLKWRAAANTARLPDVAGHTPGLLDVPGHTFELLGLTGHGSGLLDVPCHTFDSRQYDQDMPPCGPTAAAVAATDASSSDIQAVTCMQLANTQGEPAGQQQAMLSICSKAAYMTAYSQGSRLQSAAFSVNNSSCAEHVHHALMQQQGQQGQLQEMQQMALQPASVAAGAELNSTTHTIATAAAEAEARSGFVALTVQGGAGSSSGSNSSSSEDYRTAAVLGIDELTLPETAQPVTQQMSVAPPAAAAGAAAAVAAERPSRRHRPVFTSRADRVDGIGSAANSAAGAAADVADRCLPSQVTDAWPGFSQLLQQLSAAVQQQQQQQQQQLGVHIGSSSSHRFSTGALSAGGGVVTKQTANIVQQPASAVSSHFKDAPQRQQQQQLCGASSFTSSLTAAATGQLLPLFQPAATKSSSMSMGTAVAAAAAAAAGAGPAGRSPTSVNSAAGTFAAAAAAAGAAAATGGIAAGTSPASWLTQDGCSGQQQHTHLQQLLLPLAFPPFSSSRGPGAAAAAAQPAMSPHGNTVDDVGPQAVPEQPVAHRVPHIMQQQQQQQLLLNVKQQHHAPHVKQQHALGTDEWFAVSGLLMLADNS
jgi:hypothetical protein